MSYSIEGLNKLDATLDRVMKPILQRVEEFPNLEDDLHFYKVISMERQGHKKRPVTKAAASPSQFSFEDFPKHEGSFYSSAQKSVTVFPKPFVEIKSTSEKPITFAESLRSDYLKSDSSSVSQKGGKSPTISQVEVLRNISPKGRRAHPILELSPQIEKNKQPSSNLCKPTSSSLCKRVGRPVVPRLNLNSDKMVAQRKFTPKSVASKTQTSHHLTSPKVSLQTSNQKKSPQTSNQKKSPQTSHQKISPQTSHQKISPQTSHQKISLQTSHQKISPQTSLTQTSPTQTSQTSKEKPSSPSSTAALIAEVDQALIAEVDEVVKVMKDLPHNTYFDARSYATEFRGKSAVMPIRRESATSPIRRESATSPIRREGATSPIRREGATSPIRRESATSPIRRDGATSPIRRDGATSPIRREGATSPIRRDGVTSPIRRDGVTSPIRREGATSPIRRECATSPIRREGVTSPIRRECATSPIRREGATSPEVNIQPFETPDEVFPKVVENQPNTHQDSLRLPRNFVREAPRIRIHRIEHDPSPASRNERVHQRIIAISKRLELVVSLLTKHQDYISDQYLLDSLSKLQAIEQELEWRLRHQAGIVIEDDVKRTAREPSKASGCEPSKSIATSNSSSSFANIFNR